MFLLALLLGAASAQEPSEKKSKRSEVEKKAAEARSRKAAVAANQRKLKAAEEQEILDFVGAHQPKLLQLLKFLKKNQPDQYQRALREVARTKTRLETLEKRDKEMYAIELELWQIDSKQRLAAAELMAAKSDDAKSSSERRLKQLLKDEYLMDMERLKLLQNRAEKQVARLKEQIAERASNRDEFLQKSLRTWQNRMAKRNPNQKPKQRTTKTAQ